MCAISLKNVWHNSYCRCRAAKQWWRHYRFLQAPTPGTAPLWAHLYENIYTRHFLTQRLKVSFTRCFGAWRSSSLNALLLRPSCLAFSSAVSKAWEFWCCLNSYRSAIIAAFFLSLMWDDNWWRGVGREQDAHWEWENTLPFGSVSIHILKCRINQRISKVLFHVGVSRDAALTFPSSKWLQISDKHIFSILTRHSLCLLYFNFKIAVHVVHLAVLKWMFPHIFDPKEWKILADFVICVRSSITTSLRIQGQWAAAHPTVSAYLYGVHVCVTLLW